MSYNYKELCGQSGEVSSRRAKKKTVAFRRKVLASILCAAAFAQFSVGSATQAAETRVYTSEGCLLTGKQGEEKALLAGLAAIFLPALIDRGLTAIGGAIRKAGEKQEKHYSVTAPIDLYEAYLQPSAEVGEVADLSKLVAEDKDDKLWISRQFSCLLIVNGDFAATSRGSGFVPFETLQEKGVVSKEQSEKDFTIGDVTSSSIDEDGNELIPEAQISNRLTALDIKPKDSNGFHSIYEAKVDFSDDRTAFSLVSKYHNVKRFASTKSRSAKRGLVYTVSLNSPRTDSDGSTLSVIPVNFGAVSVGKITTDAQFESGAKGARSALTSTPPVAQASQNLFLKRGELIDAIDAKSNAIKTEKAKDKPNESKIAELEKERENIRKRLERLRSDIKNFMPVNMTVTMTETRSANAALLFLADVFDDSKEALGKKAQESIIPEKRLAAAEKLEDDHSNALKAYLNAEDAYQKSLADNNKTDLEKDVAREGRDQALRVLNRIKRKRGDDPIRLAG